MPPPLPGQPAQGQRVLQPPLSTHIVSCQLRAHSQATWGARLFTVSTGPSGRQSLTWSHTGKTSPLAGGWYKKPQGSNGGGNAAQLPLTHRILSIQGRQGGQPAAGGGGAHYHHPRPALWLDRQTQRSGGSGSIRWPGSSEVPGEPHAAGLGSWHKGCLSVFRQPGSRSMTCEQTHGRALHFLM